METKQVEQKQTNMEHKNKFKWHIFIKKNNMYLFIYILKKMRTDFRTLPFVVVSLAKKNILTSLTVMKNNP